MAPDMLVASAVHPLTRKGIGSLFFLLEDSLYSDILTYLTGPKFRGKL